MYRVVEPFFCCDRKCRQFETDTLVELGYNADGAPIVFLPELVDGMIAIPTSGTVIDHKALALLKQLRVSVSAAARAASHLH